MEFLVKPWAHQLTAIERAKDTKGFALFFEQGTGKTGTCINIIRGKFKEHGRILRTLILCPPIVVDNWKREFKLHSKIDPRDVVPLTGPGAKRLAKFQNECLDQNKIVITNYEALLMKDLFQALKAWTPEIMVLDESHKCKAMSSKRTKLAVELSDLVAYKYILSGTPVLNTPMDVFAQFRILDGGRTFGKSFFPFRNHYFWDKNAGMPQGKYFPDWRIKPGALDEINEKIYTSGMRVEKKDCLDLPPLVRQRIMIDLSSEQKRHYESMKKDFITFVGTEACTAQLAITKALRLQQIVSGFMKLDDEDGTEIRMKENPRQDALHELLEELTPNHKVIVWAVFKDNYEQIREVCKKLGVGFVEVHGEISAKVRVENVDAFSQDPKVRVFIGHPGSGGIGINLVSASYSIFYSRSFSLENDLQAEARNHRGGSEIHERVTRIDLVAKNTIDEAILERLEQKQQVSDRVLRDIAKEI